NQVLIVDYEIGDSLALDRLHDLGLTDEQIDEHVVYVSPEMTLTERLRLGLVDHVEAHGSPLTLMIIDTLGESATMAGLSTNDDSDMVSWFRSTTRWVVRQWPTCAVVVIDHLPKDKVDAEFPIGSQRKRAYPHALFSVRSVTK